MESREVRSQLYTMDGPAELEAAEQRALFEPKTLQYKVLIHLDSVISFPEGEEPWFLGGSSDSGQSGLPDSEMDMGGGANTQKFR